MYRIIDCQGVGTHQDETFKTKREVAKHLIDYHSVDFSGSDDKDNELEIWDYLKFWKINNWKEKLEWVLDYGSWDIEETRTVNVDWNTDNEDIDLPKGVEVPTSVKDEEVADWLSDNYGWCVNSWN